MSKLSKLLAPRFETSDAPRILITRLSHIGDCVLTLPVAAALKKHFPGSHIAWATEKPSGQLIELSPHVDEVIDVDRNWIKSVSGWKSMRKQLRACRFELTIDPQSITKSALLARLSGARQRIGMSGKWSRELAPMLNNRKPEVTSSHLVDRSMEILKPLGIESTPFDDQLQFPMNACATSSRSMSNWMKKSGVRHRSFMVINPGASWPSKQWEIERFGEVAANVFKNYSFPSVVVWAGEAEKQMATQICATATCATGSAAAILAPKTSLRELMELSRRALMFFGCDTGPLHIAAAVGTPCVGLYGPTRPEDSGAYGSMHVAIQKRYQAGTSRQRRKAANDAMREISSQMACEGCDRMLTQLGIKRFVA